MGTEHLTFVALDVPDGAGGVHAARWYRSGGKRPTGAVLILAHGAGAGQSHPFMTRYASRLAERGVDVITFDFPYMRSKRSAPDRAPVLEESFRGVVAASGDQRGLAKKRLFVGGKSMGGRMATHLAASESWPAGAPALAGVIVFGYPLNPPGGPSRRSPDRVSHLAQIRVPLLIVQGTRDTFGGPAEIRKAVPAAQVFEVPTGDHSFNVQKSSGRTQQEMDAEVVEAVARFVESS